MNVVGDVAIDINHVIVSVSEEMADDRVSQHRF
jgi:hypothetical protein